MVKVLPPLSVNIPLPQRQRVLIPVLGLNIKFDFLYRENLIGGQIICEITRVRDSVVMWIGVLNQYNPVEITDPVTKAVAFTIMPKSVSADPNMIEIWVFEEVV